jgi:hypothetical protein|tara:strand:- start:733 stop:1416 length:684 start_codon:yes stop_codon:yes gene_type:complete
MNQIKSVLLPGSFFEDDYVNKTKYLLSNEIDTIYLFDHSINPVSRNLGIYDLVDGVAKLNHIVNGEKKLGVCVLNVNARNFSTLFSSYISNFLEIKKFKLGIGSGDDKYETRNNHSNNFEEVINDIKSNKNFKKNNVQLFVGGNSKEKIDLVLKHSLGINQWLGTMEDFQSKFSYYKQIKNPLGELSVCLRDNHFENLDNDMFYEKIYILKDSNSEIFYKTIDNILK